MARRYVDLMRGVKAVRCIVDRESEDAGANRPSLMDPCLCTFLREVHDKCSF